MEGDGRDGVSRAEIVGEGFGDGAVAEVVYCEVAAFCCEFVGDGGAETFAAAGNEDVASFEGVDHRVALGSDRA